MSMFLSIVLMILLLSVLILVHEAGHFFAARALGIKVTKFGFGLPIGPTLWSKQVGDVEVLVHAFLLGGYVSFPDDEKDSGIVVPEEDKFMNKPVWKRMIVISAGVIANIITAFVFVIFTAAVWGHLPSGDYQVYVGQIIKEKDYSAQFSNLKENDKIDVIDSNVGNKKKNIKVSFTATNGLNIANSSITGKEVECESSVINVDESSSLTATDKVALKANDFNPININAPIIVLNGEEIANEKETVVFKKITDPLLLKRLELVNLLKRVKNECESINSEKVSEYKEELDVQPISKVLKK